MQKPLPSVPVYTAGYLQRAAYYFQCRHKCSVGQSIITQWRKTSDVNLTPYHLHITEDFSYYHLHSSPPSPPMESKGIPAVLRLCLGLFKQRSIAMSFGPIFGPWLLIFIASYFVRESLSWCYAKNLWSWFGNPTGSLGYYFYICPIYVLA